MICILMHTRSGSSMVAGIFAAHGVHVGRDRKIEYRTYENQDIKSWILENVHQPRPIPVDLLTDHVPRREFAKFIRSLDMPEPWLWKGPVRYWPLWKQFKPKVIKIRRDVQQNTKAFCARDPSNRIFKKSKPRIELVHNELDKIPGVDIFTDEIIEKDYSSLERAFAYCGIEFDKNIADKVVKPQRWHFRRQRA